MKAPASPEYPEFPVFFLLLILTLGAFLFAPLVPLGERQETGVLLMLWGALSFFRAFFLTRVIASRARRSFDIAGAALPRVLLALLRDRQDTARGQAALQMASFLFLLALLCGLGCAGLFAASGDFSGAAKILITGCVFWLAQIYARGDGAPGKILGFSLAVFLMLAAAIMLSEGTVRSSFDLRREITGAYGVWLVYLCAIPALAVFARLAVRDAARRLVVIAGIAVLALLVAGDFILPAGGFAAAFFLAGWLALSVLWALADEGKGRAYRFRNP